MVVITATILADLGLFIAIYFLITTLKEFTMSADALKTAIAGLAQTVSDFGVTVGKIIPLLANTGAPQTDIDAVTASVAQINSGLAQLKATLDAATPPTP